MKQVPQHVYFDLADDRATVIATIKAAQPIGQLGDFESVRRFVLAEAMALTSFAMVAIMAKRFGDAEHGAQLQVSVVGYEPIAEKEVATIDPIAELVEVVRAEKASIREAPQAIDGEVITTA